MMAVSASPYCVLAEPGDARFASIPEPASSRAGRSEIAAIFDRYATLAASLSGSAHGHLGHERFALLRSGSLVYGHL
jgi:hypothetical protein